VQTLRCIHRQAKCGLCWVFHRRKVLVVQHIFISVSLLELYLLGRSLILLFGRSDIVCSLQVTLQQILPDEGLFFVRRTDPTDKRPFSRVAGLVPLAFVLTEESHGAVRCRICEYHPCLEFSNSTYQTLQTNSL
jgi:hypothetical protein